MKAIILFIALALCCVKVTAQKTDADEKFRLFKYSQAIPLYEKYISKKPDDYEACSRLAMSYKLTNDVPKAIEIYKHLVQLPESKPSDLLDIVQLFQMTQNEVEARQYANSYKLKMPGEKADNLIKSLDNYDYFMSAINDYTLTNKTGKYPFSVLSAYPLSGRLVVTAENRSDKSNKWTGRSYTDLYVTDKDFNSLDPFASSVMTDLDDGIPTFTDNDGTMYFTSVNRETVNENNINTRKLHIIWSQLKDDKWAPANNFTYNSNDYNTAHPTISKDGNILVFASDMPGGKGGMDLYYCLRQGSSWSAPQNIAILNTSGNEIFPVFQNNNTLVFSSNGLPGLGGLDLFISTLTGSSFSAPQNVKAPLNSSYDDYCLISDDNLQSGYLTSNRSGNTQIDNVFYFEKSKTKAIPPAVVTTEKGLKIKVVDKYTHTPLPYVSVTVKDKNGDIFHKGLTDEDGTVVIDELPKGAYSIQGILNDVTTTIANVSEVEFNDGAPFISKEVNHNDPRFTLKGVVINNKTGSPIEGVTVTCKNETLGTEKTITTQSNGQFFFQLEQKSDFKVSGQKTKWLSSETAEVTTQGLDRSKELYVKLTLNLQEPSAETVIRLKKIYYDYDKCNIKPMAAEELDRLVKLMNDYPDMIVELSSHTDSRGSDDYNMKLSQCRADAAVAYILGKEISKDRIVAKGYGETRLLNKCVNGVKCSEEMHQENRRTEFKIISCKSCPRVQE